MFMRLSMHSLIVMLTLLLLPGLAHAHGHGHAHHDTHEAEELTQLKSQLEERLALSLRYGSNLTTSEQQKLGELLLEHVHEEIVGQLKAQGFSWTREGEQRARELLQDINPVAIARWLIDTGRRHGPALAIAVGTTEMVEQLCIVLSAKYPQLLFMVPLYLTHFADVAVVALSFGLPKAINTIKVWQRSGGLRNGPAAYYRHLLRQRAVLPIDWSVVVKADSRFAVIKESWLERALPRELKLVFSPRKLAQRESGPAFSLHELEAIARLSGLDLRLLRRFKEHSALYASILLREISLDARATDALSAQLAVREAAYGGLRAASAFDATEIAAITSAERLAELGALAGETADLLAERVRWYYESRVERAFESLEPLASGERKRARKLLRRMRSLVASGSRLQRVAMGAGSRAWQELAEALGQIGALDQQLERILSQAAAKSACESVLLGRDHHP